MTGLSIIIPAYNEEEDIEHCLDALIAQSFGAPAQVIVAANGCCDQTVTVAEGYASKFLEKGYSYQVLDISRGGKANALNQGDKAAIYGARAYLDADIICSPDLLRQLAQVLDRPEPTYASGTMQVSPAKHWASRAYSRFWGQLPFITNGVPGAGLYCVNAAGRARWSTFPDKLSNEAGVRNMLTAEQWQDFPDTFSDDTYVRLLFTPSERVRVTATYSWPIAEGFSQLMRVRRRQDANTASILTHFPELILNDDEKYVSWGQLFGMAARSPLGFVVYAAVKIVNRIVARK